ncbi:MAG TPA: regulatory protein RecX [Steroidobacteraceae bacterium]|nr:regulatory protein RecX [Steroidobacteraceae bacterium]
MAAKRPIRPEAAADPEAIRAAALALLARRDWLTGELKAKLQADGYDPQASAGVVAELMTERLLDDARYAERYVASRAERGQGPVRIAAQLASLGAPRELIDAALESGPDWRAVAAAVRRRKFGVLPPDSWATRARQARFLQYRGFSADHIRAATGADLEPD